MLPSTVRVEYSVNFYHIIAKMEINSVISAIAKIAPATATLAINPAQRSETVIRIKQQLGLDPIQPPNDTISVYIYALIEYGVYKPEPLLKLFREKEIQKAFWKDFNTDHPLIFTPEIEHFRLFGSCYAKLLATLTKQYYKMYQ